MFNFLEKKYFKRILSLVICLDCNFGLVGNPSAVAIDNRLMKLQKELIFEYSKKDEDHFIDLLKEDLNHLVSSLDISLDNKNKINISYECMTCWDGICEYKRKIDGFDDAKSILRELIEKILSHYYACDFIVTLGGCEKKIIFKNIIDGWKTQGAYDSKVKELVKTFTPRLENLILNLAEKK